MKGFTYILQSEINWSYYIGSTTDPQRRLHEHNNKKKHYTSKFTPWKIVILEKYDSLQKAKTREREIKNWKSRIMIEKLIKKNCAHSSVGRAVAS